MGSNRSHAAGAGGCATPPLAGPAFEIFDHHLRFDPSDPEWPLRDRFVLSAGHASMLLYSLLHLYGELSHDEITRFGRITNPTVHIGLNQLRRVVNSRSHSRVLSRG